MGSLLTIEIETSRFHLRELTVDDASDRYLGWFADPDAAKYISAAAQTHQLGELRDFIRARAGRRDVLFLGIFDRPSGLHVGNIKYEPVDEAAGYAVMGMLIGEPDFRSRGVAREVLDATGAWLRDHRNIHEIVLGVHEDNLAAIRAYQRAGFRIESTPHLPAVAAGGVTMLKRL